MANFAFKIFKCLQIRVFRAFKVAVAVFYHKRNAVDKHGGFAAAGACQNQHRPLCGEYGPALFRVEVAELLLQQLFFQCLKRLFQNRSFLNSSINWPARAFCPPGPQCGQKRRFDSPNRHSGATIKQKNKAPFSLSHIVPHFTTKRNKNKHPGAIVPGCLLQRKRNYLRTAIRTPAATAEPITPSIRSCRDSPSGPPSGTHGPPSGQRKHRRSQSAG